MSERHTSRNTLSIEIKPFHFQRHFATYNSSWILLHNSFVSFVNYSRIRISKNNLSIFLFFISLNFDKVLFLLSNFLFEAIDRFFSIILYYYISSSKLSSQNRNITFSNEISHFFLFFFSFNPPTNKCSYIYFTLSPFHPRLSPLLSATATYYTSA